MEQRKRCDVCGGEAVASTGTGFRLCARHVDEARAIGMEVRP